MSKKLEKLREVNKILKAVLTELEVQMFINKITDINGVMTDEDKQKLNISIKQ